MTERRKKEVMFLRYNFTQDERLEMGSNLAQAHNRMSDIESEEAVMKAQVKDRKAGVEQTIGAISRNLANGYEMRNIDCRLDWDVPSPNEVTYVRTDTNETVKVRPFTDAERQETLGLTADQSQQNIAGFFDEKPTS